MAEIRPARGGSSVVATTELESAILRIVKENSGGIKFVELVSNLTMEGFSFSDFDGLLATIRNIPGIQVLSYTMDLGGNMGREKYFIYTP